jgi:thymidylate synthase (FAD)
MRAEYIDHMGDDLAVVNAARVSFDKESKWERHSFETEDAADTYVATVPSASIDYDYVGSDCWFGGYPVQHLSAGDAKLIGYLARNGHWTPFAHTAIKLRMGAPVPIRTQCFKHKFGFVENEESRRYISSEPELFVPEHFRTKADSAKQGSGGVHPESAVLVSFYERVAREGISAYLHLVERGACPEQARFVLPQGVIVNWIWTGSLAAFARFYKQRSHSHAQQEARDLAEAVAGIIQPLFPVSWAALTGGDA